MTNILARRKAIELRKLRQSYNQIRKEVAVSKSTLSVWLRRYPLSSRQIYKLNHNEASREKFRNTMRAKKEEKLLRYYQKAQTSLLPLTKKELFIAGLFLYWGEGRKTHHSSISISNTNPSVLQFSLLWMTEALLIPKAKIKVLLHLYSDMNVEEMLDYWSNILTIPKDQFIKPYIKTSKKDAVDYKGYAHGTCMLKTCNASILQTVLISIKAFSNYSNLRITEF